MPSQETYLDLYAPLTFAERMGVRNQEIRRTLLFPCCLQVCVDLNVQKRFKRELADGKQRHEAEDKKCLLKLCPSDDTMRT
ncbi:hypothetical protein HPL003_05245 [Paenibacillus terrae HPL-003]|uniref:Uncharacterized protein n=1 Tax=Paenibacillus terrae (strain HPL-003) TaxID=985665 RepID=G7VWZ5_PAETH|nr:hypothetical protein HPL003_05245 [Paenibacillus terrae HPL-003]